jgi:predicted enzyme related to lactoylglutathione lyase
MASETCRLALVILAVEDLARARAFYTEAFGWTERVAEPVYTEFELPAGLRLGLYERRAFGLNTGEIPYQIPNGAIAATELYFVAPDLDAEIARVTAAGALPLSPRTPRGWGDEAAYFADPDGNVLVLSCPP